MTPNSAHHDPSLEKRLDVTVYLDAVGLRERTGFSRLRFLKSSITSYVQEPAL